MSRQLTRTLIALAVPALTVAALAAPSPAGAAAPAAKGPKVPTVAQVAKTYPHLAGGTSYDASSKVIGIGKNCKPGKPIKGATMTSSSYQAAEYAAPTATEPMVYVSAMRFRNADDAIDYLHATSTSTTKCPTGPGGPGADVKVKVKKIRFKLGDERWGWTITSTTSGQTSVMHSLLVRDGRFVVSAGAMALDGGTPVVKKAIQLTALTLKTAS